MRLLLDTQAFLWTETDRGRFRPEVVALLEDPANDRILSSASAWEIAISYARGRLQLPSPPNEWVPERMRRGAMTPLPIELVHALHVARLPPHHSDPFDRIIIAQAQVERLPVLTSDPRFADYDVDVLWTN